MRTELRLLKARAKLLQEELDTAKSENWKAGWQAGVKDAIRKLKSRRAHYESYKDPEGPMVTHPVMFAAIDEMLIFLEAMLERGTYASPVTLSES